MLVTMTHAIPAVLQVFIEPTCETCRRAIDLAKGVDEAYPQLAVRIVDIREPEVDRDDVFAVPTFVLDGRVLSLGTPLESTLREKIEVLLTSRGFGTLQS